MRNLLVVVLLVIGLLTGCGGGGGRSVRSEFIAIGGSPGIRVVNPDGTNMRQLTTEEDFVYSISPDGTMIAYGSFRDIGHAIYVADSSTGQVRRLTVGGYNSGATFSRDGKKIVFDSDRSGDRLIYTMNADGTNVVPLPGSIPYDNSPVYMPDGRQIVFASGLPDKQGIYIMNVDGTNKRRLSPDPSNDWSPSVSPDGTKIVFISCQLGPPMVFIMDIDGSNQRCLVGNTEYDLQPVFSPDGQRIAFISAGWGPTGGWKVCSMNIDGTDRRLVVDCDMYQPWIAWWGPH